VVGSLIMLAALLILGFTSSKDAVLPALLYVGLSCTLSFSSLYPSIFSVLDSWMFGTGYGLMSAFTNTFNMIVNYFAGNLLKKKNLEGVILLWAALAALSLALSIAWNILDWKTGGIANLPEKDEEEEVEDEHEEDETVINDERKPLIN